MNVVDTDNIVVNKIMNVVYTYWISMIFMRIKSYVPFSRRSWEGGVWGCIRGCRYRIIFATRTRLFLGQHTTKHLRVPNTKPFLHEDEISYIDVPLP